MNMNYLSVRIGEVMREGMRERRLLILDAGLALARSGGVELDALQMADLREICDRTHCVIALIGTWGCSRAASELQFVFGTWGIPCCTGSLDVTVDDDGILLGVADKVVIIGKLNGDVKDSVIGWFEDANNLRTVMRVGAERNGREEDYGD